jgi:hypothetical protein
MLSAMLLTSLALAIELVPGNLVWLDGVPMDIAIVQRQEGPRILVAGVTKSWIFDSSLTETGNF